MKHNFFFHLLKHFLQSHKVYLKLLICHPVLYRHYTLCEIHMIHINRIK